MKMVVVSIFDTAAQVFSRPVFVGSVGQASRSFGDEINRVAVDNEMNRHPQDYILYELGSFDDNTGKFENSDVGPRIITRGADVVNKAH